MVYSAAQFEDAARRIDAAAFDPELWPEALEALADAGGGWACQLLGVGDDGLLFDFASPRLPREVLAEFEARGGVDPRRNARARVLSAPPGRAFGDYDFGAPEELARSPFYQDYLRKHDADFVCVGLVRPAPGVRVVAAVTRSRRQGHCSGEERTRYARLLRRLEAAARLQLTLEARAGAPVAGALEAVSVPAVLLDAFGRVVALNPGAEVMLAQAQLVTSRLRRLRALEARGDARLQAAIRRVCAPDGSAPEGPIRIHLEDGAGGVHWLDIAAIPQGPHAFRTGAAAIVAFPRARAPAGATGAVRAAFGLSAAEAEVALTLARGVPLTQIAAARNVAVTTVRNQLKSAFQKAHVNSQAALVGVVLQATGGG